MPQSERQLQERVVGKEGVAQAVKGMEKLIKSALVAESMSQFLKTALRIIANGSISGATYRSTAARL